MPTYRVTWKRQPVALLTTVTVTADNIEQARRVSKPLNPDSFEWRPIEGADPKDITHFLTESEQS